MKRLKFKQPFCVNRIEFTAKAKKGNIPKAKDIVLKINGRRIQSAVSYFKLEVPAPSSVVYWELGLKKEKKPFYSSWFWGLSFKYLVLKAQLNDFSRRLKYSHNLDLNWHYFKLSAKLLKIRVELSYWKRKIKNELKKFIRHKWFWG